MTHPRSRLKTMRYINQLLDFSLLILIPRCQSFFFFFFLNDPAPPEIYPLPLHDALPISGGPRRRLRVGGTGAKDHAALSPEGHRQADRPLEDAGTRLYMRDLIASIEAEYRRYKTLGEGAMDQLADSQLAQVAGSGNSIVTIVWHLAGNLKSRFTDFLTSDGEKPWRDRDSEFLARAVSRKELQAQWEDGWRVLFGG